MAINPGALFPANTEPPDADYPYGGAKDETTPSTPTVPGSLDGTPWVKSLLNDNFGFQQALLTEAAIVPSGNAETSLVSQYLDALKALFARLGVVQIWTALQYFAAQTITSVAGELDWNWDTEQVAKTVITEDTIIQPPTFTGTGDGAQARLLVTMDGTGGWAVSFAAGYESTVEGGDLPVAPTDPGASILLNFDHDGTVTRVA